MPKELKSYLGGKWIGGSGAPAAIHHAVTGEAIAQCNADGVDLAAALEYGRAAGAKLRAMTFPQRAALLKDLAGVLNAGLPELYDIAYTYGATKFDAWMDIEGGIGTMGYYASVARKALPEKTYLVAGDVERLSKEGTFVGHHLRVPQEGVAVEINAFNFPAWGMLEKFSPALIAGVPTLVKPATCTAPLAHRIVELLVGSGKLPDGALQLVCGSTGNLLDHLTCQDSVAFTGSAVTGAKLRSHPNIIKRSVRFNMEADSLNCTLLAPEAAPGSAIFDLCVKEVLKEMTIKAGQKCTAIRRVLVPAPHKQAFIEALSAKLVKSTLGDPKVEGVRMGPLVSRAQVDDCRAGVKKLQQESKLVYGNMDSFEVTGADRNKGFFFPPLVLDCNDPMKASLVHEVEVFGPVATVIGYRSTDEAVALAKRGGGSLAASVFTENHEFARQVALAIGAWHGRIMLMNEAASKESTGHGSALPQLLHGGPGRAGGGAELAGLNAVYHHMQTVAIQGDPARIEAMVK